MFFRNKHIALCSRNLLWLSCTFLISNTSLTNMKVSAFVSCPNRFGKSLATAIYAQSMNRALSSESSMELLDSNPFLQQKSTPKFSQLSPEQLTPAVDHLLQEMDETFSLLEEKFQESGSVTSFNDVLPEIEKIQAPLQYTWGVAGHLKSVNDSESLRSVYQKSQPNVVKAFTKFSQSKPTYDALSRIKESVITTDAPPTNFLEQQQQRAIEKSIRSMQLGGVALEGEAQERFNEIRLRLAELTTQFSNNVLDATKAFSLTIDDVNMVKGVPESALNMWAKAHQQELTRGANSTDATAIDPIKGPWRITLDGPSYINAMQFLPDRDIRQQVYTA